MASVIAYQIVGHGRSEMICRMLAMGARSCGDDVMLGDAERYQYPTADIAMFYGMAGKLRHILADYVADGRKAVYVDLGYWGRIEGGRRCGFHKVSVNGRHPTGYFQKVAHSPDRFAHFNLPIKPWRVGGSKILLAGFSAKHAHFEGYKPLEWETRTVQALRNVTDRPIVYRPKPSCKMTLLLPGTLYSPPIEPLEDALVDCHAIVTHHSNVACDALLEGIPAFAAEGVAVPQGSADFSLIEQPLRRDDRAQWAADVAHTQFNVAEMRDGVCWRHLKSEGLIP